MPESIGPAKLLEQIADDNPRAIVAIWQTADGDWVTGRVVSGSVRADELIGRLEVLKMTLYEDSDEGGS